MTDKEVVIVGAARTPMGGMQGALADCTAAELGAVAIRSAVSRAGVAADQIDELYFGTVVSAGQKQAQAEK